jgi:secondary thiamine-phosphate synthase enzyme
VITYQDGALKPLCDSLVQTVMYRYRFPPFTHLVRRMRLLRMQRKPVRDPGIHFYEPDGKGFLMYRKILEYSTRGEGDVLNLTSDVQKIVQESGIAEGLVHLFVTHSTAALTTIEYEEGVLSDLKRALSVIAPDSIPYAHDRAWGDGNGRSHVKAAVVGPSLVLPVVGGELRQGTWQQVVLLELDVRSGRRRTVICSVTE